MDYRRLILLFVFSISLVMLWEQWQKYNHPKEAMPSAEQASVVPTPSAMSTPPAAATPAAPARAAVPTTGPAVARGETISVKTDLYAAEISSVGGDIVSLGLLNYRATEDKSKSFHLFEANHQYAAQSGLIGEGLPNHKTKFNVVSGPLSNDADVQKLRLEAPVAGGVKVAKVYTFKRGSYVIDVAYEIDNGSGKELSAFAYYQLQRDAVAPAGESSMVSTFTGPAFYTEQEKFQKVTFEEIEKGKAKFNTKADNGWVAMVQHYFVAAWLPQEKLQREYYVRKLEAGAMPNAAPPFAAGVIIPVAATASGSKAVFSVPLYAGPQIQSTLEQLAKPSAEGGIGAAGLPLVVDYGWLTIVAAPIFWCLEAIHKQVGNWGWAIVLLTIGIKLIFFPLSAASYKSMAKMRAITPRMQALKERCGDDRQKLNEEMMKLYKMEKINPLGGCLPILVQIPVFIALYWALLGAVEMRDAPWIGWITDLSSPDTLFGTLPLINMPLGLLPIIMVASMIFQTKLNPVPPDPIQAKVTIMMPYIFGVMFFWFPSGLVLYWVVNNVLSIAQQWQITRMIESGGKAANDAKA